jgi:hypothetical protein
VRTSAKTILVLAALALAGCGSDQSSTDETAAQQASGANGPQSAQGPRPAAPDDAISGRPGGPQGEVGEGPETHAPSPTDERRIEATVNRYVAALNAHDGGALCALLAPGALDGVPLPVRRGSCAASLDASIGHPAPGGAPRWLHTRLVGADSVVLVKGGDGRLTGTVVHRYAGSHEPGIEDDVFYLRRSGDRWLIVKPGGTFYRAVGAKDVPLSALTPPQ